MKSRLILILYKTEQTCSNHVQDYYLPRIRGSSAMDRLQTRSIFIMKAYENRHYSDERYSVMCWGMIQVDNVTNPLARSESGTLRPLMERFKE